MNESKPLTPQKLFDLAIYGHAVLDTIFDYGEPIQKWGGIYNVQRAFDGLGGLSSKVEVCAVGEATIFIDRENSSKDVRANINKISREPNIINSRWIHIAYWNELGYYPPMSSKKGIVSVDLCKGNRRSVPEEVDYAFLSNDEFFVSKESRRNDKTVFIAHSPNEVTLWKGGHSYERFDFAPEKNIAVLGAGDYFAACFIHQKLNMVDDLSAVVFSIKNTQRWLLSR